LKKHVHPRALFPLAVLLILLGGSAAPAAVSITASSTHSDAYPASAALDGDRETRWASAPAGDRPQWVQIDFGQSVGIDGLEIRWEHAFAAEYQVQVSDDGRDWRLIRHRRDGKGGRETLDGLSARGRFLRLWFIRPGPFGLYSIWEIELRGDAAAALTASRQAAALARRQAQAKARDALRQDLDRLGVRQVVFAARHLGGDGHWYANFGYYARETDRKAYGKPAGRLSRLDLATGKLTHLIDDPQGAVRDPQVHYDGKKILFSYRRSGTEHYNLYEVNSDGTGLTQLTTGDWDDIEPTYLPDGGIIFCSSRAKRWVNCWLTEVATLHRCDADGRNIRPLSSNNEQDNTPWPLPDGRILYQRWEYVDRSQVDYHHLWTMNPDGTSQQVFFGNLQPGIVMIDAKPIAGTSKVLATFSPGHGQREHEGPFYVLDPDSGPDDRSRPRRLGNASGRDPYPLGDRHLLYAKGRSIRLADEQGNDVELHTDPQLDLHEPRPLQPRPRERVIPARSDAKKATGLVILSDVRIGRNMHGVRPGEIRKLLVLETLPKPINFTGGMDPLTYGGSFTLERIVGTVPVEPDGSAYIKLPALRSFFFVALDENDNSVKRMQSFLTVQPGEVMSCVGCHEKRTLAAPAVQSAGLLALKRPASRVEPVEGVPDVLDFPRDVQPILNRHCVSCHDYEPHRETEHGPRAGGVILTGDRGPMFSHAYYTLTVHRQFADGRNEPRSNRPPRSIGASASPLMKKLAGEHYGVRLSSAETNVIRYWIESGAPYPGTYAALGTGMIGGYYENNQVEIDAGWPESRAAAEATQRRCGSCHQKELSLPRTLSDENGVSFWRPDWNDPRLRRARHLLFNLSRPDRSLALLAPLSKEAGGYARCITQGRAVFADRDDADFQKILAMCTRGKHRLEQLKRFDMPGFRPDPAYVREMRRYGILTAGQEGDAPLDVYEIDQRYWQSLWYVPPPR
jgi:hypothetical protein